MVAMMSAAASVAFLALWRDTFRGPFEPRVLEIAREQFNAGRFAHTPSFSGMPFLEKPPLPFDLLALGFHVAGEPSVPAARIVHGLALLVGILATFGAAWAAAGPRTAMLAGCLLVTCPVFYGEAARIAVDGFLAATLALAVLFLSRATATGRGPLRRVPWFLGLAAGGLAFLMKGFLGSVLFLAPLLAYAGLTRDGRVLRALLRPGSIVVLALPVLLWAAILYADGGRAYLLEAFVNNSVGRFLHLRLEAAGTQGLPYGDVGGAREWWYYVTRLGSLAGPATLVLPFAVAAIARARPQARGARTRLAVWGLCLGLVPPLLLTFSSQKGVHHLGSCATGFALLGAVWLGRYLPRRTADPRLESWAVPIALLAPIALVATLFGLPCTRPQVVAGTAVGLVPMLVVAFVSLRRRNWSAAVYGTLAWVMTLIVLTQSPGWTDEEDRRFLEFPRWLEAEIGDRPLAWHNLGDSDLGAICWTLRRELIPLSSPSEMAAYLAAEEPRFVVVREPLPAWPDAAGIRPIVFASGGCGDRLYTVFTNAGGVRVQSAPTRPPPGARHPLGGHGDSPR